jgi:predicted alpha/beta superfamily hydrolase
VSAGQLRKHGRFRSRVLRNQRDLMVYLPPGYDDQPFARFPVLYLQDGQNLFDRATAFGGQDWNVHGAAEHMIGIGAVQPLIIVGIYNMGKSRIHEYTPSKAPKLGGGRADRYAKFLLEEVMPFIAREYRILPEPRLTGIGGSSLGALVALYLGLKHPHIFGKIAALSPSVWWHNRMIAHFASTWPAGTASAPPGISDAARRLRGVARRRVPGPATWALKNVLKDSTRTGTPAGDSTSAPLTGTRSRALPGFFQYPVNGADVAGRIPGASRTTSPPGLEQVRRPTIWLDIGTKEGPRIVPDVEQFRDVLLQKGWRRGEDLHYERVEGAEHNELAWSHRIPRVLHFLYPASPSL